MLHHDDRITQVAQFLQRTDQALVVPLVQTNRRFVEDIQHVDQLRTNLRGQSDALALTARQRGRLTVQRQIIQSHVQEEIQSGAYLLQYLCGNLLLLFVQVLLGFIQPFAQFRDIHRRQFRDVLIPDTVGEGLTVQSLSVTLRTLTFRQELVRPFLTCCRVVVLHRVAQIFDDAVEGHEVIARRMNQFLGDAHILQGAIQYLVHRLLGNILNRRLSVAFVLL